MYDVNPNKFGQINNLVTFANNYGTERDVYSGIDLNANARLPRGVQVSGGVNIGHEVTDNFALVSLTNVLNQSANAIRRFPVSSSTIRLGPSSRHARASATCLRPTRRR